MIYLIFNSDGILINPPIIQAPTPTRSVVERYADNRFDDYILHEVPREEYESLITPVSAEIDSGQVVRLISSDAAANTGFIESAGDFIARLPLAIQGDFDDLVKADDRVARVLDRFVSSNGTINTGSQKTQGSVMYLAGVPIPDERGDIHQLAQPILTIAQAQAWLAGEVVEV